MRLRLRDGDHGQDHGAEHELLVGAAMRLRLRDGDHGCAPLGSSCRRRMSCNAAPSQGRRSPRASASPARSSTSLLQCGSVSGTEITRRPVLRPVSDPAAAMRLRLRDGDHPLSGDWRPLDGNLAAMRLRLRDGDHPDPDRIFLTDFEAAMRLRLRDGDHGMDRQIMPAQIGAAMRLRLRDGDHWRGGRSSIPTNRSPLQCGSVSGTEITLR